MTQFIPAAGWFRLSYCERAVNSTLDNPARQKRPRPVKPLPRCPMNKKLFLLLLPFLGIPAVFSQKITVKSGGVAYNVDIASGTASVGQNYVKDPSSTAFTYKGTLTGDVVLAPEVKYKRKQYPVTTIEAGAFSGCSRITSITIPGSVSNIEAGVFSYHLSDLKQITVSSENEYYKSADGALFSKDMTRMYRFPQGRNETGYTLPSSVVSVEQRAFSFCSNLRIIVLPDHLNRIGDNAFEYCRFDSLAIPESVTEIGDHAFDNCSNLTSVTIPEKVSKVGSQAFNYCYNLKSVICRNKDLIFAPDVFSNCSKLDGNIVYDVDIRAVTEMARQGDPSYQYRLAMSYLNGEGLLKDQETARAWFEKSAAQGYVLSQAALGDMYSKGLIPDKNHEEAIKWYTLAAGNGNVSAQSFLGDCYFNGIGVKQDPATAVRYYQQAAGQGDENACKQLGYCFYFGKGTGKDYQEAAKWYLKTAQKGDAESAYYMALMLYDGQGMEKNDAEALNWAGKALDGGIDVCRWLYCELAYRDAMSLMDKGDYASAIDRFTSLLAYDEKNTNAYINRGYCYLTRQPEDYVKAGADFRKALELDKDNRIALENMEVVNDHNKRVAEAMTLCNEGFKCFSAKDYVNAVGNYAKAASLNNTDPAPYCCIGYCFFACELYSDALTFFNKSLSVDPDYQEAIEAIKNTKIIMLSKAIGDAAASFSNPLNSAYNNAANYGNSPAGSAQPESDPYRNNATDKAVSRELQYGKDKYHTYYNLYEQEQAEADSYFSKYKAYGNLDDLKKANNCQSRANEYLEKANIWK